LKYYEKKLDFNNKNYYLYNIIYILYRDYHLKWKRTPRTVLIVKKPKDNTTEEALIMIAK